MRHLLLIAALACPLVSGAEEKNFIQEFYDARKIEKQDPEGAIEGMKRSFRKAIADGNSDYATAAGSNACMLLYEHRKVLDAGKLAREVIDALEPFEPDGPQGDALRRATIFGYLERGLLMEGKTGAAWQANRAAAETLRGKKVAADADGASITVREVIRMRPDLRSLGWRLIEREAELLDLAGRGVEALALLDEAAAFLGKDWQRLAPVEQFYAFKLLAARATILDFLGYQRAALTAEQELVRISAGNPHVGNSRINLRLNLLRNLSQWEGPSEKILEDARAVGGELKALGDVPGVDRLLAKMELDLRESEEARSPPCATTSRATPTSATGCSPSMPTAITWCSGRGRERKVSTPNSPACWRKSAPRATSGPSLPSTANTAAIWSTAAGRRRRSPCCRKPCA